MNRNMFEDYYQPEKRTSITLENKSNNKINKKYPN